MKVSKEKEENRQVSLRVEMEPAEVEKYLDQSYRQLVRRANIPGFRRGKAPREVLERYLGREGLLEHALERLLPEAYEQAIREQGIEAFATPSIELKQADPLIFTATVPLKPLVKLGNYQEIRVVQEEVRVGEEDVERVLEQLRRRHGTWEPVEREVRFDDLLTVDIQSSIEGKPFINREGAQYEVLPAYPLPGFPEQVVGMKAGEEKEFDLRLPQDYPEDGLAGKEAHFRVRVIEVKQLKPPPLNDEFASLVNPELKTLAELREKILADLRLRAEERSKREFEEKVIEAVVEQSQVEFPPLLVDIEVARLLDQMSAQVQAEKSGQELQEELRPLAIKRVTRSLILEEVAKKEKIEVSDEEVKAELERLAPSISGDKNKVQEWLNSPETHRSVRQLLGRRKTIRRLVEIAGGAKNVQEK